jgi:pimeloyl-ACP methyl ester carboxylesterase
MSSISHRRLLLTLGILSALGIAGCDVEEADTRPQADRDYRVDPVTGLVTDIIGTDGGSIIVTDPTPGYYMPGTHPLFSPATGELPLNTDILFSVSEEDEEAGRVDGTAMRANPANPVEEAINKIDGWSTSAGFDIAFSASLDPASVVVNPTNPLDTPAENVFVIALNNTGDALDPDQIDFGNPIDSGYDVPVIGQVVSLDGVKNNTIRVAPSAPLDGPRKYLVIVTNGVKDKKGDPITASASYEALGVGDADACADNGINEALHGVCDAIGGWEQLAVGYLAVRNAGVNGAFSLTGTPAELPTTEEGIKASLALTYTFTTTDTDKPLQAMSAPRAALFSSLYDPAVPASAGPAATAVAGLYGAGLLPQPEARSVVVSALTETDIGYLDGNPAPDPVGPTNPLINGVGNLYTGSIELPYYQQAAPAAGTNAEDLANWEADRVLGAQLGTGIPPSDTDGSYNVTYRYPFAAQTGEEVVPLQVTLPAGDCGASGCPVVIYIHGITNDRTSAVALAHTLAGAGVATVAIDLPMHGVPENSAFYASLNVEQNGIAAQLDNGLRERHFNVQLNSKKGKVKAGTDTGSGSLFINLSNFANTRDNMKQAVMDLLNLNASLAAISALDLGGDGNDDFDLSEVYVVGVSLGGILGSVYTAVNQEAYGNDALVYGMLAMAANPNAASFAPTLNPIKGLVASVPGGQVTRVLENSTAFSARILPGLAANDVEQGSSSFEKFMYVFQGMVDQADPVTHIHKLTDGSLDFSGLGGPDLSVPVVLQEVVGGGNLGDGAYPADLVVPNNAYPTAYGDAIPAPLAGTDPLAVLLGIDVDTDIGDNPANGVGVGGALLTRLTLGYHGSLLTTGDTTCAGLGLPTCPTAGNQLATGELQTQVVSFVLSGGAAAATGTAGPGAAAAPYTSAYSN